MDTEPKTDGLVFFDPTVVLGTAFVWDDAVHIVDDCSVSRDRDRIAYCLKCGKIFAFAIPKTQPKPPMEAVIRLPKPNCTECIGRS
jgi:hypothetical protein